MISKEVLHKKTPQQLTALLYEACLENLETAKEAITNKEFFVANEKLQKANDILHRLGGGLNYEAGIIADQLDSLYNYLSDRVIRANYEKNVAIIDEVIKHVEAIYSAWSEAMKVNVDQEKKSLKMKKNAYEQNVMYE